MEKYEKLFKKIKKYYRGKYRSRKADERIIHIRRVFRMCYKITQKYDDLNINQDLLLTSALLHDIAKPKFGLLHPVPLLVSMACKDVGIRIKNEKQIADIVYYHSGKKFRPKAYPLEAAILRMCDKIDKFHTVKIKKATKKCKKSYKLIVDYFEHDHLVQALKAFLFIFEKC